VAEIAIVHSRTRKDAVAVQPAANDPAPKGCRNYKYPFSGGTDGRIASFQSTYLAELNGTYCA